MFNGLFLLTLVTVALAEQIIDLSNDTLNTAGIGFSFIDSQSMITGKSLIVSNLPNCQIGNLDALYFYVYGCSIPTSFIATMINENEGFLYSSDKSLTMISNVSQTSLLLANMWNLELTYENNSMSTADYSALKELQGCKVELKESLIEIGCGSLNCEGCDAHNFFSDYNFCTAKFLVQ